MESTVRRQYKRNAAFAQEDMISTEIAEHFNFTLPALSSHLRILKDADLITEKKQTILIE